MFFKSVSGFMAVPVALRFSQLTSVCAVPVTSSMVSFFASPDASKFIFWMFAIAPALLSLPFTFSVLPVLFAAVPPARLFVTREPPLMFTMLLFVVAPSPPVTDLTATLVTFTVLSDASAAALPPTRSASRLFSTVMVLPVALPSALSVKPP